MLKSEEIARYKRHLLLKEIGGPGQQRLKASSVLIVGAGGLGSPVALYLAAAGVGRIAIIDDDRVSLDNLQRQIAFRTNDKDCLKAEALASACRALNPHVAMEPLNFCLSPENAMDIIHGFDLIVDGSDNFATRYLVNDACYFARKPLVFAALGQFEGYLTTFRAFDTDANGNPLPSYRCLFPEAPPAGVIANCEEAGVLGPVAGVMGTLQAVEALKELAGLGDSLAGRLVIYDAFGTRFQTIMLKWDPANPLNGANPSIFDLTSHIKRAA